MVCCRGRFSFAAHVHCYGARFRGPAHGVGIIVDEQRLGCLDPSVREYAFVVEPAGLVSLNEVWPIERT